MINHRHRSGGAGVRIGKMDRELIRWFARHGTVMGRRTGYLISTDNGILNVLSLNGGRLAEWTFPFQPGQKIELRTREPRTDFERAVLKALQEDTR